MLEEESIQNLFKMHLIRKLYEKPNINDVEDNWTILKNCNLGKHLRKQQQRYVRRGNLGDSWFENVDKVKEKQDAQKICIQHAIKENRQTYDEYRNQMGNKKGSSR